MIEKWMHWIGNFNFNTLFLKINLIGGYSLIGRALNCGFKGC